MPLPACFLPPSSVCLCGKCLLLVFRVRVAAHVFCTQVTLTHFSQFAADVKEERRNKGLPAAAVASGAFTLLCFQHGWPPLALFTACIKCGVISIFSQVQLTRCFMSRPLHLQQHLSSLLVHSSVNIQLSAAESGWRWIWAASRSWRLQP